MITDAAKVSLVYAPGSLFVVSDLYSAAFARVVQSNINTNITTQHAYHLMLVIFHAKRITFMLVETLFIYIVHSYVPLTKSCTPQKNDEVQTYMKTCA